MEGNAEHSSPVHGEVEQSGLAGSIVSLHDQHATAPISEGCHRVRDRLELQIAADERRLPPIGDAGQRNALLCLEAIEDLLGRLVPISRCLLQQSSADLIEVLGDLSAHISGCRRGTIPM